MLLFKQLPIVSIRKIMMCTLKLSRFLILAATKSDYSVELQAVTDFYKEDICKAELQTQLEILAYMNISKTGDVQGHCGTP